MRRWTGPSVFILMTLCLLSLFPVQAQQNLLQNPGFEGDYVGQQGRGDFTFPAPWEGWYTESPHDYYWMNVIPTGYPHHGPFRQSGDTSLSIAKGSGSFTAAVLQRVPNIPAGAVLRASAYVYLENNEGTNAQVRIGIGSNVGNNVNGAITWSEWEKRVRGMHQISVEHVATGGEVTVFVYTTQTWANDPNALYVDEASLTIVGQGTAPTEGGDNNNNNTAAVEVVPSVPNSVPFVSPQKSSAGEDIVHVVGSGDTIASISVAYGVKIDAILALNGLDRKSILQIGQRLLIATPDPNQPAPTVQATEAPPQETEPVATEEAIAVVAPPVENVPSTTSQGASASAGLISQHASSVNMKQAGGGAFNLTFTDNLFQLVQIGSEFSGAGIPLNFWTEVWTANPNTTIQDAILFVDVYTIKLSLSALQFNPNDNSVTYNAVFASVTNSKGEAVDIATIPDIVVKDPDLYFAADTAFFDAMSATAKSTSIELGTGFLCSWLNC